MSNSEFSSCTVKPALCEMHIK
uniref:Uncharacterized protein n=1 Tax=Anguilla anguilla TaxID=7936 RepID=A0A0E9RT50_ANGAN